MKTVAATGTVARTARVPDLTPQEARNWRLAKLFDLRSFIGALFVIFGVTVLAAGLTAGKAAIARAAGINLALWVGGLMLATGLAFIAWLLLKPPAPVTTAEAKAARKAREEFGTSAPVSH